MKLRSEGQKKISTSHGVNPLILPKIRGPQRPLCEAFHGFLCKLNHAGNNERVPEASPTESGLDRGTITPLWLGHFAVRRRLKAASDEDFRIATCFPCN
jgi:hypothetical protein